MKILNNSLFLEFSDTTAAGIPENTIWKAKQRNSPSWSFTDDPDDKRKVLIEYDKLKDSYKELVTKRFGNVYEYVAKEPIRKMVARDIKAFDFFLQYRFDGTKSLPDEYVEKYTVAASWLNLLINANNDKKDIKKTLNISIGDFWVKVCEIIESDKIDLPSSLRRLRPKIDQYKEGGYETLISKHFCNDRSKKVNSEVAEAILLEMINHHNQHDDVFIAYVYNIWAAQNDHKPIHPATVGNWRRINAHLITANREGNSAFNEKYIRQVKGFRPTEPLYLVEHDDNNLDFLFLDPNDSTQSKYYKKYVSICVIDSSCDLLLGKCYMQADAPKKWMIRQAYIDAMYYIRSLTGGWYLPFEVKADRWASASMYPFYGKMAKFIEPSHGNKHRGYIEQFFRTPLWKRAQKIGNDNWSGNNMTAVHRGVNMEMLQINKSLRRTVGNEAEQQIENFFHRLRHMPDFTRNDMNALSKEQQWLARWNELPENKKRPISDEQFLQIFGIVHNPDNPIRITNRGVEPQISNRKYSFDLPNAVNFTPFIGAKVNVIYDPYDMSRVLVTNGEDIRFIAKQANYHPRALQDQYTGSRTYLNAIQSEKKEQVQLSSNASSNRKRTLSFNNVSAEAVLQGGYMEKEIKYAAEQHYQLPINDTAEEYDPLDDM